MLPEENPHPMKAAFINFASRCWPQGVHDEQLRDMIRVFHAGWIESLKARIEAKRELAEDATDDIEAMREALSAFAFLVNPRWVPNRTWRWWVPIGGTFTH